MYLSCEPRDGRDFHKRRTPLANYRPSLVLKLRCRRALPSTGRRRRCASCARGPAAARSRRGDARRPTHDSVRDTPRRPRYRRKLKCYVPRSRPASTMPSYETIPAAEDGLLATAPEPKTSLKRVLGAAALTSFVLGVVAATAVTTTRLRGSPTRSTTTARTQRHKRTQPRAQARVGSPSRRSTA